MFVLMPFMPFYFNPRSREGSDKQIPATTAQHSNFNPRSREGSDNPGQLKLIRWADFNPRSREGSDAEYIRTGYRGSISIRAPAKGATIRESFFVNKEFNFNPRSREGSDFILRAVMLIFAISIRAPAKGATELSDPS